MVIFHVAAISAFWFFSWTNVITALVLHWLAVGFGISLGYHRLHTHRGFKTSKAFEYFLAVCGTLTLEGGPIFWVSTHRVHHQHSDHEGDPHSPNDGGFWAHMGWILFGDTHHNNTALMAKYAPDLAADPFYRWLNTYHYVPLTLVGLALLAIGGWPMVLWGIGLRVVFGLHATWLVNSATHMWGSRRFNTRDDSRNSWWVALLTFGEGWHNNHHAHPVSARHGLAWYEFDISWLTLQAVRRGRHRQRPQGGEGPRPSAGESGLNFRLSRKPRKNGFGVSRKSLAGDRYPDDMITGRRRSVIFFTVLGVCLVALALTLNISWIVLNWERAALVVLGVVFFLLIIAGMVLNTIFLVREIRRNEQHDSFINAVTHELKTPVASIRLYLETLQTRELDEAKRREFYRIMLEDSDRLLHTIEQVLRAGSIASWPRLRRSAPDADQPG